MRFLLFAAFGVHTLQTVGQSPIQIPSDETKWKITKSDTGNAAPPGYEGRTDIATEHAVGIAPETAGQTIDATMTIGNQIRTCPFADGTAEGTGEFSIKISQTKGDDKTEVQMITKAKYKGQVGDNALLEGPVKGEMDYTYTVTHSNQHNHGAFTSSPTSSTPQHITIPIVVLPSQGVPSFGAFSGGDPTKGHYSEALATGLGLAYWAGVYYSVAETKWYGGEVVKGNSAPRPGVCVDIAFDPPGNTLQPPLGTDTHVTAMVKTKSGQTIAAHFIDASAFSGGSVEPKDGLSVQGTPMKFTYTAPNKKTTSAGFSVAAFSRAGTAVGEWKTGLGTGWSGQITYESQSGGDEGHDDLQTWSNSGVTRIMISVRDGVGTMDAHVEGNSEAENRQKVATGGFIKLNNSSEQTLADGSKQVAINVRISPDKTTYSVGFADPSSGRPEPTRIIGKSQWSQCNRYTCSSGENPIYMPGLPPMDPLSGKLQDLNHIQASQFLRKDNLGRSRKGWIVETMTVDLARSGSSK